MIGHFQIFLSFTKCKSIFLKIKTKRNLQLQKEK